MAASGALCARLACDKKGPIPGEPGAVWRVCCTAFVLVATRTPLGVSTSPGRALPSLGRSLLGFAMLGLNRAPMTMRGCSSLATNSAECWHRGGAQETAARAMQGSAVFLTASCRRNRLYEDNRWPTGHPSTSRVNLRRP
jgi:hypothetical protein